MKRHPGGGDEGQEGGRKRIQVGAPPQAVQEV